MAEYSAAMILARAQKLIVTTCDTTILQIRVAEDQLQGLALLDAVPVNNDLVEAQLVLRRAAVTQLGVVQQQWQALVDEARLYDMTDAHLGRVEPADSQTFATDPEPL